MGLGRVVGMMLGCLGIGGCLKIADQPSPSPSDNGSCADSHTTLPTNDAQGTTADAQGTTHENKIKLRDGRYLAYTERGVPKHKSKYKVIVVHGFASSKDMHFLAPQELIDELGIYLLLFDRAGYGESDPNVKRSLKSEASDIEQLADQLQLGPQFYLIGVSVGAYPTWSCLRSIPERLAGVALVVPYINYKWKSLPRNLIKDDFRKNLSRMMLWVASHTPGLLHWWLTQKAFPSSSVIEGNPKFFSNKDLDVLRNTPGYKLVNQSKLKQEDVYNSLRRDFIVAFGKWDFDPLDLKNPYDQGQSSVHIWQGCEDKVVPVQLQRHVSQRLPWIQYHEVPDGGHLLVYDRAVCESVLRSLLLGEDPPLYRPKFDS